MNSTKKKQALLPAGGASGGFIQCWTSVSCSCVVVVAAAATITHTYTNLAKAEEHCQYYLYLETVSIMHITLS